jgi:hypothetical protein
VAEDQPLSSETFGHALERIAEGGLLRLLGGKPLELAISRLVTGVVAVPEAGLDIPKAYFEGISQRIRSENEARKQLSDTVLNEAKRVAAGNEKLTERALRRWSSTLDRKQKNIEEVAARTIKLMADQKLPETAGAPSEEFMGPFSDIAENASTENLADLLARILTGEIRKPGTFSRRALQTVSALDQRSILALVEALPYLLNGSWFHIPPNQTDVWRPRFSLLSIVGITNEAGVRILRCDETNRGSVHLGSKGIVYTCEPATSRSWFIDGANLTLVGAEILTALPQPNELRVREVALGFKEHKFIEKVEICDITISGDKIDCENYEEVL